MPDEIITRTSCGYPEICRLAVLLDMTPTETRLECLIRLAKEETDECIIWPHSKTDRGYGTCWLDGLKIRCSRYLLSQKIGRALGKNEFACHSCDNPSCVNPRHIFLGSPKDNTQDMVAKGRHVFAKPGEGHHGCKLTEAMVRRIRESTLPQDVLAKEYGCSQANISFIKLGKRWKHIA